MKGWLMLLGAIALSGVLLQQSLPLGEKGFLAWFAFVPMLRAVRGKGFIVGFVAGILTVFTGALLAQYGFLYAHPDPGTNDGWLWTGFGLFGFASALVTAMVAEKNAEKRPAWWFAAWAILFESVLLLQLPAHLGLTQYRHPLMLMITSVGGIWLVSFLVWLSNLWLARLELKPLVIGSFCAASLSLLTSLIPWRDGGGTMTVAALQVDVSIGPDLAKMHTEAGNVDLVVWPEFAGILFEKAGDTKEMKDLSLTTSPFVTSFPDDLRPLPHNTATLFHMGKEGARYYKRKLFGGETKTATPGTESAVAALTTQTMVGLNVCYDSCFPSIMRDTAAKATILTLPTNDPPSSHHFIAGMHAAYSTFRCAESGMPLVRADSLAYSHIVDSRGHIVAEAEPGTFTLKAKITPRSRFTLSKVLGDWWLYACGILAVFGWVWFKRDEFPATTQIRIEFRKTKG